MNLVYIRETKNNLNLKWSTITHGNMHTHPVYWYFFWGAYHRDLMIKVHLTFRDDPGSGNANQGPKGPIKCS